MKNFIFGESVSLLESLKLTLVWAKTRFMGITETSECQRVQQQVSTST